MWTRLIHKRSGSEVDVGGKCFRFNVLQVSRAPANHHAKGEDNDAPFSFNRSIRIRSRRDRITGDSRALTGRELLGRSRVVRFLAKRLPDKRDGRRIRHSQKRLARTLLLLAGQGRREHSDATELRDDPALRLATSDRAGTAPMGKAGRLPSQPTLSRRVAAWSAKEGVEVLREGLQRLAGWRLKAMGGWRRPKTLVIDIDRVCR